MVGKYDIQYRVHVSDIGWKDWQKNGTVAGVIGKRIEAIEIRIVNK